MKSIVKSFGRDPLLRWVVLSAIMFFFTALGVHFLLYAPLVSQSQELELQLTKVKSEYSRQQNLSTELAKLEPVQERLDNFRSKLTRPFSSVAFSSDMERFISESGVEILAQSYSPPRMRGDFQNVEVNLRISSEYEELRKFISLLNESQFLVVIEEAKLESRDAKILGDLDLQVRFLRGGNASD
ncbi:GspMb/PilO family protein [Marinobacter nauticus]